MYFLKYIYFYAGCFYLFFGSLILVFRKFFIQSKVFPDFKKVKNHCLKTVYLQCIIFCLNVAKITRASLVAFMFDLNSFPRVSLDVTSERVKRVR